MTEEMDEQTRLDMEAKDKETVSRYDVLGALDNHNDAYRDTLKNRSGMAQEIIGAFLATFELEFKKTIKDLPKRN